MIRIVLIAALALAVWTIAPSGWQFVVPERACRTLLLDSGAMQYSCLRSR